MRLLASKPAMRCRNSGIDTPQESMIKEEEVRIISILTSFFLLFTFPQLFQAPESVAHLFPFGQQLV